MRIFQASHLRQRIQSIGFKFLSRHWAHSLHVPYWWLKCLFWNRSEELFLVTQYHRLLVWDLMQRPCLTQFLDRLLNPFLGKSVVMYFRQPKSMSKTYVQPLPDNLRATAAYIAG